MENVILRNELLRWSGCCPRARETTLRNYILTGDLLTAYNEDAYPEGASEEKTEASREKKESSGKNKK